MAKRWLSLLSVAFACVSGVPAQTSAPVPGAASATQRHSASEKAWETEAVRAALDRTLRVDLITMKSDTGGTVIPVDIEVQNMSAKTITAFTVSVSTRLGDGTEKSRETSVDCLGKIIDPGEHADQPFTPGSVRHLRGDADRDRDGLAPIYVDGQVTMVIFEDRTAIGDPSAIREALQLRARRSQYFADLLADVRSAQADPAVSGSLQPGEASALPRLRTAIAGMIAHDAKYGDKPGWHEMRGADLKSLDRALMAGKAAFDARVQYYETVQRGFSLHSTLGGDK